jgi:uncharacterized protein YwgA
VSFDTLRGEKSVDILLALYNGGKGVREIQTATGGSHSTIQKRISELLAEHLIKEEYLTGEEFGEIPVGKRLISLSEEGRTIIESLLQGGFLKLPRLSKDRQKWLVLTAHILNQIRGRTRFMKLLFLLRFELGLRKGNFFRFKPWIYGPFSEGVVEDLEELERQGFMQKTRVSFLEGETREERVLYMYEPTTVGRDVAQELLKYLPRQYSSMLEELRKFNDMPLKELLIYIYKRHPKFIKRSIITERILGISRETE